MDNYPLVSIIIPTYARPENLLRALSSCQNQTYPNIEIIVVDDNGKGSYYQIQTETILSNLIESGSIKYIAHTVNKNGSAARNTGLSASSGQYINFVDDDDELFPEKIEKQVKYLQINQQVDAVCCETIQIYKNKESKLSVNIIEGENFMPEMLQGKIFFNTTTVLFRRQCLMELNGWDETFYRHQDYEIFMRFNRRHRMGIVTSPLIKKHTTSSLNSNPIKAIGYLKYFLNKFKNEIDSWPTKNIIYKSRLYSLSLSLISNGYKKEGLRYLHKALKKHRLSFREIVFAIFFTFRYKKVNRKLYYDKNN